MRSREAYSSHAKRQNLSAPSLIERIQLNSNDFYSSVSSEPFIEDENPNPTATPKFHLFICMFFDGKCILDCFE